MSEDRASTRTFTIYPAIDILGGSCVRLFQGDYGQKTEYNPDPQAVAERWLSAGAKWLHVVDLDAAKTGSPVNRDVIASIVALAARFGARVQIGGGIRTHDAVDRWLQAGAARCIIGTAALEPGWMAEAVRLFGSNALVAGLDGRNGKIAVRGWIDQTDVAMTEAAVFLAEAGVRHALVTDVSRDGTLQGANLALAKQVQDTSGLHAIASGGIRNVDDVLAAESAGLAGVIAGRSLYDGTLDLAEAIRRCGAGGEGERAC